MRVTFNPKTIERWKERTRGWMLRLRPKRDVHVEAKRVSTPKPSSWDLRLQTLDTIPFEHFPKPLPAKLTYGFCKKYSCLPFQEHDTHVCVVVFDPLDLEPIQEIQLLFGKRVELFVAEREMIHAAISFAFEKEEGQAGELLAHLNTGALLDQEHEVYDLLEASDHVAPIIKLLNLILIEAIQQGASDIHFDPTENGLKVRFRIDGVLQTRHASQVEHQAQLITRLKVMARLDIAEKRLPQDGRIKLLMGSKEIDFRVSTLPVSLGERVVLRVLDRKNVVLGMDTLAMPSDVYQAFQKLVHMSEGIVLVTGPTGSGKTTTLYSAITDLTTDAVNIMTVEDPVEYNLPGIAQIGVATKIDLTFAKGLRHILRQDPDVIMIGEIRDEETARIAIQSSLTGHLVLSTLHTNDAPSALTRLVDMGIEPYLLSSTVLGVLAQRLVRTLCPSCKEAYVPTDQECETLGQRKEKKLYRERGCPQCFESGFKGRKALYELMPMTPGLQKQVVVSSDSVELKRVARQEGLKILFEQGKDLVCAGETTLSEVLRVCRGGGET